ncbi:hypothetical protein trd_1772 [Thermomicrobium roseum DSM 5159]|uniref:Uncharacterized protein n=1 Tax=Thermomicrobium roseum (strain ATCC 27502 / DSM 5159 / P-2) TaxID=309801 RepID=B9L161_THERP|nr:hypothetical protein trd_1772 [Thermomicrobium roseum DSM 5159]
MLIAPPVRSPNVVVLRVYSNRFGRPLASLSQFAAIDSHGRRGMLFHGSFPHHPS